MEPVPGGPAEPPATGLDERQVDEVRQLVRALPWREWAEARGAEFQLMAFDADVVQAAICEAMTGAGITLDQAAEIGRAALGEAKSKSPVGYVADAFRKHLPRRLRALAIEPLAENPLPLPSAAKPPVSVPKLAKQGKATPAEPDEAEPKPVLPACSTCRAEEGETYPSARTVTGADGREQRCPDCLPPAAA